MNRKQTVRPILLLSTAFIAFSCCSSAVSTEGVEKMGRGDYLGATVGEFASLLRKSPDHAEYVRASDTTLGLRGWVQIPGGKKGIKTWYRGEKENGFPAGGYVMIWNRRLEEDSRYFVPSRVATSSGAIPYSEGNRAITDPAEISNRFHEYDDLGDHGSMSRLVDDANVLQGQEFSFWVYSEGETIKAYSYPVKKELGGLIPYAIGLEDVPPVVDSLLHNVLGLEFSGPAENDDESEEQ